MNRRPARGLHTSSGTLLFLALALSWAFARAERESGGYLGAAVLHVE